VTNFVGTVSAGSTISTPAGRFGVVAVKVVDFGLREFALTCAHVVAPPWSEVQGTPIDSPAILNAPAGARVFGTLYDWSRLRDGFGLTVDAALIRPNLGVRLSNESLSLGDDPRHVTPTVSAFLAANPHVGKLEIFTGRRVLVADVGPFVDKDVELRKKLYSFRQVLSYQADVLPGDSGSVVLEPLSRSVVGIHFAGDAKTGYSIPIENILGLFSDYQLTIPRL
jgi:hypothetical protein